MVSSSIGMFSFTLASFRNVWEAIADRTANLFTGESLSKVAEFIKIGVVGVCFIRPYQGQILGRTISTSLLRFTLLEVSYNLCYNYMYQKLVTIR